MLELRAKHKSGRSCRYECLISAIKSSFKPEYIYTSIEDDVTVNGYRWSFTKGGTFTSHIMAEFKKEDNTVDKIVKTLGFNKYIVNKIINENIK